MEAQKTQKPRRLSDLSFEPGFSIEIQMQHEPLPKMLNKEMVLTLLMGIDKCNPWYAPNNAPNDPDPVQPAWISFCGTSSKLRCTHERSVLRENQLGAYLRYIQTIGKLLFQYLECFGVTHVSVLLDLVTLVRVFSAKDNEQTIPGAGGGGGLMS